MSYYSEVVMEVEDYFKKNLPQYEVIEVRSKSIYAEDYYLYMVSAFKENDNTYAVWTTWNQQLCSLNGGHYNLQSLEDCEKIFAEHYNNGK